MAVFTNFATLSYKGGTRNSNTVTGEIIETVAVEKTTVSTAYTAGDTLSYAVSLVNSGPADVTGLTVTDDLGAYELDGAALYPLAYVEGTAHLIVNGTLQPAPTVTAGPPLVFTDIDIPAGGSAVLVYEADVTGYAPLSPDSVITNTVTVTGGGVSVPLTASAAVGTMDQLDLRISKALSPCIVPANGEITYTFEITNTGNTEAGATDNVVVSDNFDPILSISPSASMTSPGRAAYSTATMRTPAPLPPCPGRSLFRPPPTPRTRTAPGLWSPAWRHSPSPAPSGHRTL